MPAIDPKDALAELNGKKGRWVTVKGRRRFIPAAEFTDKPSAHGLNTNTSVQQDEAGIKQKSNPEIYVLKASYNNSSQDSSPKKDPKHDGSTEKPPSREDSPEGQDEGRDEHDGDDEAENPMGEDNNRAEEPKSTENRNDETSGEKGIPIYVATTHDPMDEDKDRMGTDAKIGEKVKYDLGRREGQLIKIDGIYAVVLRSDGKYDTVEAQTVYKVTDYTRYGLWKDIPTDFRVAMLRKVHVSAEYANKRWIELPRQLKDVLIMKADGSDTFSRMYDQHRDPSATNDFEGAKEEKDGGRGGINSQEHAKDEPNWQSAFENKTGEPRNPNVPEGQNSNIINPQDDKRRDGRQHYDNEETNNTIRDNPEEEDSTAEEAEMGCGDELQSAIDSSEENDEKYGDDKPSKVGKDAGTVTTGDTGYDNTVYGDKPRKKAPVMKSYGITYGVTEIQKNER